MRLLFVLLSLSSTMAFAQIKISGRFLKIQQATRQSWSPGVVQKNSQKSGGTIYQVTVKVKKSKDFILSQLIVDNQSLPLEVVRGNERGISGPFKKGEMLQLLARTNVADQPVVAQATITEIISKKNWKGCLLLSAGRKTIVTGITEFKTIESANKN